MKCSHGLQSIFALRVRIDKNLLISAAICNSRRLAKRFPWVRLFLVKPVVMQRVFLDPRKWCCTLFYSFTEFTEFKGLHLFVAFYLPLLLIAITCIYFHYFLILFVIINYYFLYSVLQFRYFVIGRYYSNVNYLMKFPITAYFSSFGIDFFNKIFSLI